MDVAIRCEYTLIAYVIHSSVNYSKEALMGNFTFGGYPCILLVSDLVLLLYFFRDVLRLAASLNSLSVFASCSLTLRHTTSLGSVATLSQVTSLRRTTSKKKKIPLFVSLIMGLLNILCKY